MSFQMRILISVLCFVACSEAMRKLQDNVYVIESSWTSGSPPEEVHLHCNASGKHNASVYWKKDNTLGKRNASWIIKVKEPRDAGNFTCWSSATNELLHYTTLYVIKIKEQRIMYQILERDESSKTSTFNCTANNYSGNFTCSWMIDSESQNRNLKFAVSIQNADNTTGNVTCEEPVRDFATPGRYSVSCKKEKNCSSTEEFKPTEIRLDVFDEHMYETDTRSFFIKYILKPDITECEIARDGKSLQVTWEPPPTWSFPVSYFPLKYQIKTVGTTEKICEVDIPTANGNRTGCSFKITREKLENYYIRSRDYYSEESAWSEWSKPCSGASQKSGQNHHTLDSKIKIAPCDCLKN